MDPADHTPSTFIIREFADLNPCRPAALGGGLRFDRYERSDAVHDGCGPYGR